MRSPNTVGTKLHVSNQMKNMAIIVKNKIKGGHIWKKSYSWRKMT